MPVVLLLPDVVLLPRLPSKLLSAPVPPRELTRSLRLVPVVPVAPVVPVLPVPLVLLLAYRDARSLKDFEGLAA